MIDLNAFAVAGEDQKFKFLTLFTIIIRYNNKVRIGMHRSPQAMGAGLLPTKNFRPFNNIRQWHSVNSFVLFH